MSKQKLVAERKKAAEEVCYTVLLAMALGGLDIPLEDRDFLAKPMEKWTRLCVKTGTMEP